MFWSWIVLVVASSSLPSFGHALKCQNCHPVAPNKINVHLVPHTHDDVGWLKTVDQYYYGSNKGHSPAGVQYIIDSVVSELLRDKNRRFVYVETSFLWRWWLEQNEESRADVRMLVEEGRLQLLHGGWCMSDEASPHYSSMIDQMTFGLKFLNETFGECGRPRVAWQIDPFGHSSEVALQFAAMGYNGVFFGRIDQQDFETREGRREMEMMWRPDTSTGEEGELFTGILFNLYQPPPGFCWDTYCDDEPIMDNPKLHGYNVDAKINQFIKHIDAYSHAYRTNNILVTMGGDFNYISASPWFKNMDKLIKYINKRDGDRINVIYSTPACYLEAIHNSNISLPLKDNDDFFPYGSDQHSYWTGYYTSRPALKYFVEKANAFLQAVKQLTAGIIKSQELLDDLELSQRAVAITQHHDGVSGTEKQHVADDYSLYLNEGVQALTRLLTHAYRKRLGSDLPVQVYCGNLNISRCEVTESNARFIMTAYNSLSHPMDTVVYLPVSYGQYKVTGLTGAEIPSELVAIAKPVLTTPVFLRQIASLVGTQHPTHSLVFTAKDIPPLGLSSFFVERLSQLKAPDYPAQYNSTENLKVKHDETELEFNATTGLLQHVNFNGTKVDLMQSFHYYEACKGYNYNPDNRASGAYIFRPAKQIPISNLTANITVHKGKQVTEVHQAFNPWMSQVIRIFSGSSELEFCWLIGPVPVPDWNGKEIITRYTTDIPSNKTFYTDSNGRRWVKRILNYRSSWNMTVHEPVAGNYYPLTSAIQIRDELNDTATLTVITDRAEGGTSLHDGEIEIMLHRRLVYDDMKGVSEPLDESAFDEGLIVRGCHIVQYNTDRQEAVKQHRLKTLETVYSPILAFAKGPSTFQEYLEKNRLSFSLVEAALPKNIHILTLEHWGDDTVLLRLEHIFEINEHKEFSKPETVNLQTLFKEIDVLSAEELTLGANILKKELDRYSWNYEAPTPAPPTAVPELPKEKPLAKRSTDLVVTIKPMEIKTYRLYVKLK
ncbi:unnamed protein product [Bemisia tabaci]|uniref:Alpha-mannosidase n=1 Tax=Bemisia tabaci TaxID=7038 RepID=A0A7S5LK38_BEMTA|nr:PREDICTED: lysosomal alpha-mannosidase-like [Bemisia tabaci]QHB15568.1 lysosomal alpha-mannosidase-like protein [Bemisia tabaci]CAH0775454.1 unnamed protein product [Bemisia tabaci]